MTVPSERDDEMLRALFASGADESQLADQELSEAFAAYQKVEALFDLLRRPATAVEPQPHDHLAAGEVLGEFAILRPLASGGMGQVYLARQQSLGRLVALKVCKPEIAREPRMKSRFTAEALSLAQLTHPNVVPVVSTGEDRGYLFLAMEYVAGPTLAQVLQAIQNARPDSLASAVVAQVLANPEGNSDRRQWAEGHAILDRAYQTWAVQTLQQVAQGLAAVHAAGILHRDIKPANIIFAVNGVPKIVDFGLARTQRAPSTTVVGEFYGTPAYASPEQARGDLEAVKPWSDVFSFGVTLFECLSLGRPFPGRTSADVLSAVLNSDAPLLRQVEKRIPPELEAITDKCLRKNPAERYPSGHAVAEDLRNYLELRPVSARPPSRVARVGRMIRRRPWVAAFLLTLVVAGVLGVFLAKHAWADYQAERLKTFVKRVDEGDVALFRCLTGQRPTWLPKVIEQYRQQGIEAYSAALQLDPNAVRPLVQRARLFASKKETLDLALADLDKAQQLQPGFGSIRKFRGYVLEELGSKEEGRDVREEAKTLYPTAAEDLYWLGVIAYSKEQDFFACYTYFSQALLIAPNDYWSRLERAYFGRIASEGDATGKRVIPELEIAKTLRPDLPFASELLGHFYSADLVRRKKELEDQIERFGLDILRAHQMSELLQEEKRYDEAEAILQRILDQDTRGQTAAQIGDLEYRMGHYDRARQWYQRAIGGGANYPNAYMKLAYALIAMKDWKAAERAYLDGIDAHPNRPFLYGQLGYWFQQRGQITDAEKMYRKGCELPCNFQDPSPTLAENSGQIREIAYCFQSLARLLGQLGRPAERVEVLERAVAQLDKALASAGRALRQSAEEHLLGLKAQLGEAYVYAGRRQEAIALIDTELKKKPLTPSRARRLVDLLRVLGGEQAALEVGRLAEFAAAQEAASSDRLARQLSRTIVDTQLQRMGLYKELFDRLETRRALGEKMAADEYGWFVFYQGAAAVAILGEGVEKYPDSVLLHSNYLQVLAKAGRKQEAWKAYETARDLYFDQVDKNATPGLRVGGEPIQVPLLPPVIQAVPWYAFLLQAGKDDEFRRLEERLREVCPNTKTEAKALLLPRAMAEFGAGKYAAAAKSLEGCLQEKLWNELASEAMITGALARSLRALGRRQDAIKAYRRAVQISGVDPALLSEFLCLVVEEEGVNGLRRELPNYDPWQRLDVRLNATLTYFSSWAALATGDEKAAFENMVQAGPYFRMASQQPLGDEGLVCAVILQIVSEKLADSKRLARATGYLKGFPAERVRTMRAVFALPNRK
jgi:serine/threonine protein kinase/tetratricopeptide (TPR) repeat protein